MPIDRQLLELVNQPDPDWLSKQQNALQAAIIAYVDRAQEQKKK